MKKVVIISATALGGLGGVLLITPPHFGSSNNLATTSTQKTAPSSSAPASTTAQASKTFVGSAVDVGYGIVQVSITVKNGQITSAKALQTPTGRSNRYTQFAVPVLIQETIQAQSAHIQGASGASYTSYGWATSLQAALNKAGL